MPSPKSYDTRHRGHALRSMLYLAHAQQPAPAFASNKNHVLHGAQFPRFPVSTAPVPTREENVPKPRDNLSGERANGNVGDSAQPSPKGRAASAGRARPARRSPERTHPHARDVPSRAAPCLQPPAGSCQSPPPTRAAHISPSGAPWLTETPAPVPWAVTTPPKLPLAVRPPAAGFPPGGQLSEPAKNCPQGTRFPGEVFSKIHASSG